MTQQHTEGVIVGCLKCKHKWDTNDNGIYCPKGCGTVGVNIKAEDGVIFVQLFLKQQK